MRWQETPGRELTHQEAKDGNLGETWACTQITTAEGERDKQTLETTGGALASELETEERYKFVGESPGGRSDYRAQCSRWPSWSSGLGLGTSVSSCWYHHCLLYCCIPRPSRPHHPGARPDSLPSSAPKSDPVTVLSLQWTGPEPSSPPCSPLLALLSQTRALVPLRHRGLNEVGHAHGPARNSAFSIKITSSLKTTTEKTP